MALIDDLTEKVAPFTAPIAGANPAGSDPLYEPEFERVKLELDKLTSLAGGAPAWPEVQSACERLLQEKAKDFRLCVWLCIARLRNGGASGLVFGLLVTREVCRTFWDQMYPDAKRARARANLVQWLSEQATQDLLSFNPTASARPAFEALESLYGDLDGLFSDKLGQLYPGMGGFRSALREKLRQIPAEVVVEPAPVATAPAAPPTPPPTPSAPSGPSSSEAPTVTSADDAVAALRAVGQTIISAARHLRRANPAEAWPYRLMRTGAWLVVRATPPVEGKATRIPAPPLDQRKKLEAQLAAQQWLELLNTAEDLSSDYLFWLDLHRYVAVALDRLGVQFAQAREVVGREVIAFLSRVPTLSTLTFSDGTPFADNATETWITEEGQKWSGSSGGGGGSTAISAEDEELAQRFEEARELVVGGKLGEGLSLALQLASRGADARTRFRARLNVAKLGISGGKPEVARPILEGLLMEAEHHRLEDWEPELCAALLSALLLCRKGSAKSGTEEEPVWATIFAKLCRLDPAAALRLAAN